MRCRLRASTIRPFGFSMLKPWVFSLAQPIIDTGTSFFVMAMLLGKLWFTIPELSATRASISVSELAEVIVVHFEPASEHDGF